MTDKNDGFEVLPEMQNFNEPHKEKGEFFIKCPSCGFSEILKERNFLQANEKINNNSEEVKISDSKNIFATYNSICKKYGYGKCEVLDMGIFYSDEDNLILLKCGNCGFSERVGRRTS